jgi:hypothetical protein
MLNMKDVLELLPMFGGGDLLLIASIAVIAVLWMRSSRRRK